MTELDAAHGAMIAAEDNGTARLAFFARLAETELFLMLAREAEGDAVEPETFEVEGRTFVLAFDRAERLADFAEREVPYAALSGRALATMLAGQEIGIALNPGVAPSEMLLPPDAVTWLAETLAEGPVEAEARIETVAPPRALPEALLAALDRKLALAAGRARFAYLAEARMEGGASGTLLAFIDAIPEAEAALARAVSQALTFSGIEAGALDVVFLKASDPLAGALARHGLRIDLPEPEMPEPPAAPGSDPDRPPRLR